VSDPSSVRFTRTHEWVRPEGAGEAVIGISDHAQAQLGDVIFLELPAAGAHLAAGQRFGAVESVKAASDLYSPVSGEVVEVNQAAVSAPEVVNQDPQGAGWLLRVRLDGEIPADLLDPQAYDAFAESDSH
jgi:glycine cleavage system H protein